MRKKDLMVLFAVRDNPRGATGVQLAEHLGWRGLRAAWAHVRLMRLEDAGWIVSWWSETVDGRWIRLYRINEKKETRMADVHSLPPMTDIDVTDPDALEEQPPIAMGDDADELLDDEEEQSEGEGRASD